MLTLNNVRIYVQSLGNACYVFLVSRDKQAILERYYAFYNWQCTNGELEELNEHISYFVAHTNPLAKIERALTRFAHSNILNSGINTKGTNPWNTARQIAAQQMAQIPRVNWIRVSRVNPDTYSTGGVYAEKSTGDFSDVLTSVIQQSSTHAGQGANIEGEESTIAREINNFEGDDGIEDVEAVEQAA